MLMQQFQQAQTPNGNSLVTQLEQDGYKFNFGELFKRIVSSSGIQDWDKILTEQTPEEKDQRTMEADAQQFQQALQQMNMNPAQTPPIPNAGIMQQPPEPSPDMPDAQNGFNSIVGQQ
jgi:hypothetical protein